MYRTTAVVHIITERKPLTHDHLLTIVRQGLQTGSFDYTSAQVEKTLHITDPQEDPTPPVFKITYADREPAYFAAVDILDVLETIAAREPSEFATIVSVEKVAQ